jgi:hypothetical protein
LFPVCMLIGSTQKPIQKVLAYISIVFLEIDGGNLKGWDMN